VAELIVAKQRNGPTGKVMVKFTAEYTRFDNLAADEYNFDDLDDFNPGGGGGPSDG
jgi:replicative DNA helicase